MPKLKKTSTSLLCEKPKILSLFCGAGGLDLGFIQEGFDVCLAIDFEASAIETHKLNFKESSSYVADLTKLGPKGVTTLMLAKVNAGSRIGVIGGPPCQGFSRANPGSDPNDPRNLLAGLYTKIVKELQKHYLVEFVVFENVLGMMDKKHEKKYKKLLNDLKNLGFDISARKLCAVDFGVPQNRHRIIVSAVRADQNYLIIEPKKQSGKKTVFEAIGELPDPVYFSRNLDRTTIPIHPNHWTMQPKSKRFSTNHEQLKKTRSFKRLCWDKPSPTIAFGNREIHVHPDGHRRLSIYEAMLLQGFPKNFVLSGTLSQQVQQISNAVPPPLARCVAKAVNKSITIRV